MTNEEIPKYPRKLEARMTNNGSESNDMGREKPYDLEERTALFGEAVIDFAKRIPVNPVTRRLIDQVTGAGTSVGHRC